MAKIRPLHVREFSGLNDYAEHVHQLNLRWWTNADGSTKALDKGERFMLMVSELSEAMEGDRKDLMDDHLPAHKMLHVELADTVIRLLDSGHVYGYDFWIKEFISRVVISPQTVGAELLNVVYWITKLAQIEVYHEPSLAQWHTTIDKYSKSCLAANIIAECYAIALRHGCKDFWTIVHEKLIYNHTRADHKHENRQGLVGQKRY